MIKEKSLFELKSVGSYLDYETGIIYPMNADGSADKETPISLKEFLNIKNTEYDNIEVLSSTNKSKRNIWHSKY